MEAKLQTTLAFLLLVCLCSKAAGEGDGGAACSLKDLAVAQVAVPGDGAFLRYRVTVTNRCGCAQSEVKLACPGFSSASTVPISRDLVSPDVDGKLCTLLRGGPLAGGASVRFYYAAESKFSFAPVSSTVSCAP